MRLYKNTKEKNRVDGIKTKKMTTYDIINFLAVILNFVAKSIDILPREI